MAEGSRIDFPLQPLPLFDHLLHLLHPAEMGVVDMLDQGLPRFEPVGVGDPVEEEQKLFRAGLRGFVAEGVFRMVLAGKACSALHAAVHPDRAAVCPVIGAPPGKLIALGARAVVVAWIAHPADPQGYRVVLVDFPGTKEQLAYGPVSYTHLFGLSAEDVVLGYKQLSEIERVFRDMKHLIDIRPVRRRLPARIKAHVLLCWLGMLLIRIAEQETGQTWFQIKKALSTLQVGMFKTLEGDIWQTGQIRKETAAIFDALKVKMPAKYLDFPKPLPEN